MIKIIPATYLLELAMVWESGIHYEKSRSTQVDDEMGTADSKWACKSIRQAKVVSSRTGPLRRPRAFSASAGLPFEASSTARHLVLGPQPLKIQRTVSTAQEAMVAAQEDQQRQYALSPRRSRCCM